MPLPLGGMVVGTARHLLLREPFCGDPTVAGVGLLLATIKVAAIFLRAKDCPWRSVSLWLGASVTSQSLVPLFGTQATDGTLVLGTPGGDWGLLGICF